MCSCSPRSTCNLAVVNSVQPALTVYVNNSSEVVAGATIVVHGTSTLANTYAGFLVETLLINGSFVTLSPGIISSAASGMSLLLVSGKASHPASVKVISTLPIVNVFVFWSVSVKYAIAPPITNISSNFQMINRYQQKNLQNPTLESLVQESPYPRLYKENI